jgi:diguanylate cyclase (GGDEF)-like protein
VSRARRYGRELGVVLLRLENEREFRTQFGDFFTDHLLRRIGSLLLATVRDSDVLGALDGGYAVLHTETSLEGTNVSAERLRDIVVDMVKKRFPEVPDPNISVTNAAFPAHGDNLEALVARLMPERTSDLAA